jgi:hypothetical protein
MAFARYRTGDQGIIRRRGCRCGFEGLTIVELPGRQRPAYATPWKTCRTAELDRLIGGAGVSEVQIQQRSPTSFLVRRTVEDRAPDAEAVLASALRESLGPADFVFERVDRLRVPGGKQLRYA